MHLFFTRNLVWNYLQIDWSQGDDIQAAAVGAKQSFSKPFFYGGGNSGLLEHLEAEKWKIL